MKMPNAVSWENVLVSHVSYTTEVLQDGDPSHLLSKPCIILDLYSFPLLQVLSPHRIQRVFKECGGHRGPQKETKSSSGP